MEQVLNIPLTKSDKTYFEDAPHHIKISSNELKKIKRVLKQVSKDYENYLIDIQYQTSMSIQDIEDIRTIILGITHEFHKEYLIGVAKVSMGYTYRVCVWAK